MRNSKGVRSGIYSVKVLDLAKVETIDLTYDFPAYTKLSPRCCITSSIGVERYEREPQNSSQLGFTIGSPPFDDQSTLDLAHSGAPSSSAVWDPRGPDLGSQREKSCRFTRV